MIRKFFLITVMFVRCVNAEKGAVNSIIVNQVNDFNVQKLNSEIEDFKRWEAGVQKSEESIELTPNNKYCFFIEKIEFEGASKKFKKDLQKIVSKYLNKNLCTSDVIFISKTVTDYYIKKGYITTQSYIKQQNLSSGILLITVVEGVVESVSFGKDAAMEKLTNFMVNPALKDEILNIKDLDQLTENLSGFSSYSYKTEMDAGSVGGLTKLRVTGERGFFLRPNFSFDNLGQDSTGVNRLSAGLDSENAIGFAEFLYFKFMGSESDVGFNNTFSFGGNIPFRYFKLNYDASVAIFETNIRNGNAVFTSSGQTENQSINLNYTYFRNTYIKNTISAGVNFVDSKNYINNVFTKVQSRRLGSLEFALLNNFYTKFGAIFLKLTYIRGLESLSSFDNIPKERELPQAEFDAYKLYLLYNYKFLGVLFTASAEGQFSETELFSQNQYSTGGYYSVRGYEISATGSTGMTFRSELSKDFFKYFSFGIFYDYGFTLSPIYDTDRIASTGAFMGANYKGANIKVTYAKPVLNIMEEREKIYFIASVRF